MITRLVLLLIILQLHRASSTPIRVRRSPRELPQSVVIAHSVPVLQNYYTNQILTPLSVSPLYIHQKLHNVHLGYKDNRIPTFSQNYTHPNLLPILIPIHNIISTGNRLISIQDLSVIPLRNLEKAHYRVTNEDEESNQYRNFYGGYGAGLFFGGHGAGHGFYAYGK